MRPRAEGTGGQRLMWRLWEALGPYQRIIFLGCGALVVATAAQVAGPYLIKIGIDNFLLTQDYAGLVRVAGLYIAALFTVFLFSFLEKIGLS